MHIQTRTMELSGSSYEIGRQLGKLTAGIPPLKAHHTSGFEGFDDSAVRDAVNLFSRWCPGLNEELQGFADELQITLTNVLYYGMTYLRPNCSHIAIPPTMTESGHLLVARNYEFSHEAEDFTLIKTSVDGKYTHMGTSVLHFGRDDGFNECGLSVTVSSTGFPVGPMKYMRQPKIVGLQFWAVLRSVLENCKDVAEALDFIAEMPIAYNINLMMADKQGNIALFETVDGHSAVMQGTDCLWATNHPVIPAMIPYEPMAMRHSLQRYEWICQELNKKGSLDADQEKNGIQGVTKEQLKCMLLANYPEGLCCHYFKDFFGTTKSMVIELDPAGASIELCWGGQIENGWNKYNINEPLPFMEKQIEISFEQFDPKEAEYIPLTVE